MAHMIGFPRLGYFPVGNTSPAEAQPSEMRGARGRERGVLCANIIHLVGVFELGILLSPGLALELM